jgi:hypothetical protein
VDVIIRGTQSSGEQLYYRVSLLDDQGEPVNVMRNHHYKIIIAGELSFGQKTFADALKASATNNIWVSVSDEVRRVFDNERSLEVAQTYVVVGEEEFDTPNTYDLFYTVSKSGAALAMADKPEVSWLDGNNVAQHNFVHDFDPATGKGTLTVSLLPLGEQQKREGTLVVKFGRLYRNIKVVTVKKQSFTPAWITTNVYGEQAYENVTLMFTVPETCPEELFPMDVLLSADEFDIRTASGMSLPTITSGQPGFGEPNKSGYKYVLTVTGTGMQRVYLETSLTHAVSEIVQVTVEAPHFESLVKTATFQSQTNTRILIHNLRKYVAKTPADEYIYYYQVPQGAERDYVRPLLRSEANYMIKTLDKRFGIKVTSDDLRKAAVSINAEREAVMALMDLQKAVPSVTTGLEIYKAWEKAQLEEPDEIWKNTNGGNSNIGKAHSAGMGSLMNMFIQMKNVKRNIF